jgi:hypothetical protein
MEGTERSHTEEYRKIAKDWNYDAGCTLASLQFGLKKISSTSFLLYRVNLNQTSLDRDYSYF